MSFMKKKVTQNKLLVGSSALEGRGSSKMAGVGKIPKRNQNKHMGTS